ncbi:MAG: ribonuclease Z [Bacteroidales bacterium]|jgi:ribonuclease Z|nr:ribonuclease Z [Bacteroidales bacterium]ODT56057.1 MAG: ribonuclease Z [Paludibacter sp. SCN 50-10]OJX88510.1 MAG: ribonuclease Z [Paludibacter sp. 47-17]
MLTILGSGSALPTRDHFPTAQLLDLREKQFLIDCGEGTQIRLRQMGLKLNRLGHVFISHLHGDHCFGLIGFISSLGMLNRTADLYVHGPVGIRELFEPQLAFFCADSPFKVVFEEFDSRRHAVIYDDRSLSVSTLPLRHRVPCAGFLFREKPGNRHLLREWIDYYHIPVAQLHLIRQGADFVNAEGELIPNDRITAPPNPVVSYAYCSDTAYHEALIPLLQDVDVLYHEATFAESEVKRARQTLHSTAREAATIARKAGVGKLLIGHYSARYHNKELLLNEAREVFENTELTSDMQTFAIESMVKSS